MTTTGSVQPRCKSEQSTEHLHFVLDSSLAFVQLPQVMLRTALKAVTCWDRESDSKPGYAQFLANISQEPGM